MYKFFLFVNIEDFYELHDNIDSCIIGQDLFVKVGLKDPL